MDARFTFREKSNVCWQKQLRDKFNSEGCPPVPHLDVKHAVIREISRRLAAQIVLKYEWLGTMFPAINRSYGIFFGNFCAGVTTFSVAGFALPSLCKTFGVSNSDLAYLARGACVHWAPVGTNSKLISWSCRLETKRGSKIAVAFSDTDAGEIGTVYQASNWIYVGTGSIWNQWISPLGRIWSFNEFTNTARRNCETTTQLRKKLLALGWREQPTNPKHRYVYILDKNDSDLAQRIESMRQPYPKRCAGSDTLDTLANHAGKGGSLPTPALPSLNV